MVVLEGETLKLFMFAAISTGKLLGIDSEFLDRFRERPPSPNEMRELGRRMRERSAVLLEVATWTEVVGDEIVKLADERAAAAEAEKEGTPDATVH